MKNITAVAMEARPVRPPSATPAEDSTKVVTVEVPQTAPAQVAQASASIARSMLGTLPSLSSMLPAEQAPYRVPRVSNISTMQKASIVVSSITTKAPVPLAAMKAEKSKPDLNTAAKAWVPKSRKAPKKSEVRLGATAEA